MDLQSLTRQFHQVAQEGQQTCHKLERGQAETPLADHFASIERALDSAPFTITLLGLTKEARTTALSWFYGKDYSVISMNVVEQLGLVEIHLSERGFTFEREESDRQVFDQLEPFLEALKQNDLLKPKMPTLGSTLYA